MHDDSITHFNSHAHVERDSLMRAYRLYIANFNSHAHVERDGGWLVSAAVSLISTHTLTWSVTVPIKDSTATIIDFNSHAHVERDIVQVQLSVHVHNFNSHAHVERD